MAPTTRRMAASYRRKVKDLVISNEVAASLKRKRPIDGKGEPELKADVTEYIELPHNLGKIAASLHSTEQEPLGNAVTPMKIESAEALITMFKDEAQQAWDEESVAIKAAAPSPKRRKLMFNETPFPDWQRPTPEECAEVARLLTTVHGEIIPPTAIPAPSLTISGCGEVPCVLDALIRTLLSGATAGRNSALAFQGLVQRFGILEDGVGKGSVDWDKVRVAPVTEIRDAIRRGGLAETKSRHIKEILTQVYEENMARRNGLVGMEQNDIEDDKIAALRRSKHGLSLDHLHTLSKDEALSELTKYPGVGVKTAACVILFCLRRPCFAVDTHVFRLSKWLGWIPSTKVNEISAFRHLEVRVPDHLKYSLHQLFIVHGKECPRCRAITGVSSEGWDKGCVIDHLLKRTGKRKDHNGAAVVQSRAL